MQKISPAAAQRIEKGLILADFLGEAMLRRVTFPYSCPTTQITRSFNCLSLAAFAEIKNRTLPLRTWSPCCASK